MKASIIVFPGSNCDRDMRVALEGSGADVTMVWHGDRNMPSSDLVVMPGGFSYGDYLRCGAMAAHSPIMQEVVRHGERGGYILGICNGFQMLAEIGLVPGTLMRNENLKFICKDTFLKVSNTNTPFTSGYSDKNVIRIPIAHHDGNFFANDDVIRKIEDNSQVAFRYSSENGDIAKKTNPNGSMKSIAGVFNAKKNILGMMPHPERLWEEKIGGKYSGTDGSVMLNSLIDHFA